jgi:hypothetical protein
MTRETPRARGPGALSTPAPSRPALLVRWRTLPDFLTATLGFAHAPDCAAGPDHPPPAKRLPAAADRAVPDDRAERGELAVLAPAATVAAEFATPSARARDFPPVHLVRARCDVRRGRRHCRAICPPGAVVVAGGADGFSTHAEVEESGPDGHDAWTVGVRAADEGDSSPVVVWAMCM